MNELDVLVTALQIDSPVQRAEFLDKAYNDPAVRDRTIKHLNAHAVITREDVKRAPAILQAKAR